MTASCVAITSASLASSAPSQPKNVSGASATPSRDNNSYTTILRIPIPRIGLVAASWTARAVETHRCGGQEVRSDITDTDRGDGPSHWTGRRSDEVASRPSTKGRANQDPDRNPGTRGDRRF